MMPLIAVLGYPPCCRVGDNPALLGAHGLHCSFLVAEYPGELSRDLSRNRRINPVIQADPLPALPDSRRDSLLRQPG